MDQNERISELLISHIDDHGCLKLDKNLTVILLGWIENAETVLVQERTLINNIKNLVEKVK
jgi:hypothetical protein